MKIFGHCIFPNYLDRSPLLAKPNRLRKFLFAEKTPLLKELSDRQFGDRAVNPCRAAFLTAQNIHPAFDFLADPKHHAILPFALAALAGALQDDFRVMLRSPIKAVAIKACF